MFSVIEKGKYFAIKFHKEILAAKLKLEPFLYKVLWKCSIKFISYQSEINWHICYEWKYFNHWFFKSRLLLLVKAKSMKPQYKTYHLVTNLHLIQHLDFFKPISSFTFLVFFWKIRSFWFYFFNCFCYIFAP